MTVVSAAVQVRIVRGRCPAGDADHGPPTAREPIGVVHPTERGVSVKLYPLAFLDKASAGTRYSTRAANAVATVADRAPDKVVALNNALFARQPTEGGPGLSDDEIADLAVNAGVSSDVVRLFTGRIFELWVAASTTAVFDTGISGTPTVKINGKLFKGDLYTVGPLTQAVAAAKGR